MNRECRAIARAVFGSVSLVVGCASRDTVHSLAGACADLTAAIDTQPSVSGDSILMPSEFDPSGGVAVDQSSYYVFDLLAARVIALRHGGDERWTAGRQGDGPGEFTRSANLFRTGRSQWIAESAGELFVFDGRSVHTFDTSGGPLSSWNVGRAFTGMLGTSSRIRVSDASIVIDAVRTFGVSDAGKSVLAAREFSLYRMRHDSMERLITIKLPELPRSPQGAVVDGLAQAKPSWDLDAGCVVISDGHSDSLVFGDLTTSTWDTVVYALPDEFRDAEEANAITAGVLRSGKETPLPTSLARVADVAIIPGGYLWLRPATRSSAANGELIWQIRLADGAFQRVRVSAFPTISSQGFGFGLVSDDSGRTMLIRSTVVK